MPRRNALLACAAIAALAACGRSEPPPPAPAARTQPPAVIPPAPRPPPSFLRDHYTALDDCVLDWGAAQKCTPIPPAAPLAQAGARYTGPIYAKGYREETQAQVRREVLDAGYAPQVTAEPTDRASGRTEVRP
jgi:hypothetical protein